MTKAFESWSSPDGRYTVRIALRCMDTASKIAMKALPVEVGSSLYGYYATDGYTATVTHVALVPSDSDTERSSFVRGAHRSIPFRIRMRLTERFYVGEWHSHPGGSCSPSSRDIRTQEMIAADRETNCPEVILMIVGVQSGRVNVGVTVTSRTDGLVSLRHVSD